MNLILNSEDIQLIGVASNNEDITIKDNIGFSTADLDSGFNFSDADPMYQDGSAIDYPEMDEVAAFLLAWHIPFNDQLNPDPTATGTVLGVTRNSDLPLTSVDEATGLAGNFDYDDYANTWTVKAPKDGWIKFVMIVLDIDIKTEPYYYNSTSEDVRDSNTEEVVSDLSTIIDDVDSVELHLLKTSKVDENIGYVEKLYVQQKMRGECVDEDEFRRHIQVLQMGRLASKIEFDSYGNRFSAQQIVEYLETYIAKNDLEKPNS